MNSTEIIGYVATVLLVVSFIPKKMKLVRFINSLACFTFVVYGVMLGNAWPIVISNILVLLINLYHLFFAKAKN